MSDSLVLDIGGEIGALVIHTGPHMDGAEIELSPINDDCARFHNMVHPRTICGARSYSAVFPAITEGEYTVWRDSTTRAGVLTIRGGKVTEYHWDDTPSGE
jgi:hypothetical protein